MSFSCLVSEFDTDSVSKALIINWAQNNDIDEEKLKTSEIVGSFLNRGNQEDFSEVMAFLAKTSTEVSLKDIEFFFESTVSKKQKISNGVFYTPQNIIDYLVTNSIEIWHGDAECPPKVLDPCCGSGGFLLTAIEKLHQKYKITYEQCVKDCIFGIDIDENSVKNTKLMIQLLLMSHNVSLLDQKINIKHFDSLLTTKERILQAFDVFEGFDVIVTNPPYVKLQNLSKEYRQTLSELYNGYISGSFSLSLLFLVAGYNLLNPLGCFGLITQNNLFTSLAGRKVRKFLQNQKCIKRVIDFGHHKIFKDVNAYTCLVFLQRKDLKGLEFDTFGYANAVNENELERTNFTFIPFSYLNPKKWRFAKGKHLTNLHRLENEGFPLGEVADISVGFATLKDSVFLVKQTNNYCVSLDESRKEFVIELGITKPALKISTLNTDSDIFNNQVRIIFPYYYDDNRYQIIPVEEVAERFPMAYEYLLFSQEDLLSRDKGQKKYPTWYAWGRTQGMEATGPKLLTKTFNKKPQFFLDLTNSLFCNGYSVKPNHGTLFRKEIPLDYLYILLNSTIMHYYAKLSSFQISGNYQCYQKNFIEKFCVMPQSKEEISELKEMSYKEKNLYLLDLYKISLKEIEEILGVHSIDE